MNTTELNSSPVEYDFERRFDEREALEWMQENWSKAFMFCGLYAALVFGGQHFMRERPKMNLRRPLVLWSLSLAIFSIIGALRTGVYMLHIITTSGFRQSVCDNSFYSAPVSKFWAYAFVLSKAPELVKLTCRFRSRAGGPPGVFTQSLQRPHVAERPLPWFPLPAAASSLAGESLNAAQGISSLTKGHLKASRRFSRKTFFGRKKKTRIRENKRS